MYGFNWKEAAAEQAQAKSKYKVGQRVRFTDAVSDSWWFKAGEVGVVERPYGDDYEVRLSGGVAYVSSHHIEPAFLPGDKVRVTACNGYFVTGDTGTVERQGKYAVFVKHGPYQRVGLPIEPEKLELVEATDEKPKPKFKAGDVVTYHDGSYRRTIKGVHTHDLCGGAPYTGRLGYDYVGGGWDYEDSLMLAPDCPQDNEAQGISGTVFASKITAGDCEWDLTSNTFTVSDNRPHIVALVKNGQPRPADRPYVHASLASATTEAERLARNNPGQEFAVYQRVAGRVAEVSYEMKEVA